MLKDRSRELLFDLSILGGLGKRCQWDRLVPPARWLTSTPCLKHHPGRKRSFGETFQDLVGLLHHSTWHLLVHTSTCFLIGRPFSSQHSFGSFIAVSRMETSCCRDSVAIVGSAGAGEGVLVTIVKYRLIYHLKTWGFCSLFHNLLLQH